MRALRLLLALVLVLPCLVATLDAAVQDEALPTPAADGFSLDHGVGLAEYDDRVVGVGPGYRAIFEPGGVRFDASLGPQAPRTASVGFALESIRVGGQALLEADGSSAPEILGRMARFHHPGGIVERYEVTVDGLAQSFVFDELPAERGELVVRGRMSTDLALVESDPVTGLRYQLDDLGGIAWGGVTGIDAEGRRAAGTIRVEGDELELRLPEAFVRDAALPLVLDPVVSSFGLVIDPLDSHRKPDIAAMGGFYFVVYEEWFSTTDVDCLGQYFYASGAPTGFTDLVATSPPAEEHPRVGAFLSHDGNPRFLYTWEIPDGNGNVQINCRVSDADPFLPGGCPGNVIDTVSVPPTDGFLDPLMVDVGRGNIQAPVIWRDPNTGIRGAAIELMPSGCGVTVAAVYDVTTDPRDVLPELSDSLNNSTTGMAVWIRDVLGVGRELWGRRWFGAIPDPVNGEFLIHGTSHSDRPWNPDVAGSSFEDFFVVWEESNLASPSLQPDVRGTRVFFPGTGNTSVHVLPPIDIETDVADSESEPVVEYTHDVYTVVYMDGTAQSRTVKAETLDVLSGQTILEQVVAGPAAFYNPEIAMSPGTFSADHLIAVWEDYPPFTFDQDVSGAYFESIGGSKTLITGFNCQSGVPHMSTQVSPNPGHRLELWDALPNQLAFVRLGWQPGFYPVGDTVLIPDPANSFVLAAGSTDADGWAYLDLPMPSGLAGLHLWYQWGVVPGSTFGGSCSPIDGLASLSFGIEIVLE